MTKMNGNLRKSCRIVTEKLRWGILLVTIAGLILTGCNDSGSGTNSGVNSDSNSGNASEVRSFSNKTLPSKIMADIPGSLKSGKTAQPAQKGRSAKAVIKSKAKTANTNTAPGNETENGLSECESEGFYLMKELVSDLELFKSETEFEFNLIDGFYENAAAYVQENGNPIPEGTLEISFTSEMKAILLSQFPEDYFGKEVHDALSSALEAYVGQIIKNPEMTLTEDLEDTDADGYHYTVTYAQMDIPDLEEILSEAYESIDGVDFDEEDMSDEDWGDYDDEDMGDEDWGEYDDEDMSDEDWGDYDQNDGSYDDMTDMDDDDDYTDDEDSDAVEFTEEEDITETTTVKWSKDKTKVSVSVNESGTITYTDGENGNEEKETFEVTDICHYDASKGLTAFVSSLRDNYEEVKSTVLMEEADSGETVKIKINDHYKSITTTEEATFQMEIIAGATGGQMIETCVYTDPSDSTKKITESFKETFDKDGNLTGLFFKEDGNTEWEKGDCYMSDDDMIDEDSDFREWDDSFIDEEVCLTVTGVTDTDIGIVLLPETVAGPTEEGFNEGDFFSSIVGFGYVEDGEVMVTFWGEADVATSDLKVYKETFNTDGSSTFTLLDTAGVETGTCEDLLEDDDMDDYGDMDDEDDMDDYGDMDDEDDMSDYDDMSDDWGY